MSISLPLRQKNNTGESWRIMKRIIVPVVIVLFACAALAGCGGSNKEIEAAVTGFMDAVKDVNLEEMNNFAVDGALAGEAKEVFDISAQEDAMYASYGVEKDQLSSQVQQDVTRLCEEMRNRFLVDYSIGDIQVEDETATATVTMTHGYSVDTFLKSEVVNSQVSSIVENFANEQSAEIVQIATDEGSDAAMTYIYNGVLPEILSLMTNELDSEGDTKSEAVLTLSKTEEGWRVVDAPLYE